MPTPPGGDDLNKRAREMQFIQTAIERGMDAAAKSAQAAFSKISRSADEETKKVMKDLEKMSGTFELEGSRSAESYADSIVTAMARLPSDMVPHIKTALSRSSSLFKAHGVDVAQIAHRMTLAQQVSGESAVANQMMRMSRMQSIAKRSGMSDEEASVAAVAAWRLGNEGIIADLDKRENEVHSMVAAGVMSKAQAGKEIEHIHRKQSTLLRQTTVEEKQLANARRDTAKVPLGAAIQQKGAGSDILRGILDTAAGKKMLEGENARAEGRTLPGVAGRMASSHTAGIAGEGAGALAGLINQIAPLGASMALIGGVLQTIFAAFDRTKVTGATAFATLSTGARQYGSVLAHVRDMGIAVNVATADQRMQAAAAGVNIDELNQKSLKAMTHMGTALGHRGQGIPTMVAAMNEIQAVGAGAGMGGEDAMGLAARGQRAFKLNDAEKMTRWFRSLRASAQDSGQSMQEFVGAMGDFEGMANKFGDQGESILHTMSAMSQNAKNAGLSQAGMATFMGVGATLANAPVASQLALNMAGNGGGLGGAAGRLLAAGDKGGGAVVETQLDAFRKFIGKHPGITPDEKDPKKLAIFGQAVTQFFGEAAGGKAFFDKNFRNVLMGKTGDIKGENVQKTIADAVKNSTEGGQMLTMMGAQKGSLEQLVGIARELAIMIAQSALFSSTPEAKHIAGSLASNEGRSHIRDTSMLHSGKRK